eukprot:COSAG01_NODE_33046_length_571_cov_0.453390_1_plen_137_part_00
MPREAASGVAKATCVGRRVNESESLSGRPVAEEVTQTAPLQWLAAQRHHNLWSSSNESTDSQSNSPSALDSGKPQLPTSSPVSTMAVPAEQKDGGTSKGEGDGSGGSDTDGNGVWNSGVRTKVGSTGIPISFREYF